MFYNCSRWSRVKVLHCILFRSFLFFLFVRQQYITLTPARPLTMLSFIKGVIYMCIGRDELDHPITWEMVEEHV